MLCCVLCCAVPKCHAAPRCRGRCHLFPPLHTVICVAQETLAACDVCSEVNVVFRHQDPAEDVSDTNIYELRSAAVVMLLSLLEGCNDRSRSDLMCKSLKFDAMQATLDAMVLKIEGEESEEEREQTLGMCHRLPSHPTAAAHGPDR